MWKSRTNTSVLKEPARTSIRTGNITFTDLAEVVPMPDETEEPSSQHPPWPQRLYDSVWLIAGLAILFWMLSYVVWGLVDILSIPGGV